VQNRNYKLPSALADGKWKHKTQALAKNKKISIILVALANGF
jgi:hypothetical protein